MLLDPDPHFQYGSGFTTQLVSACPVLLQGLPLRLPRREGQCLQTCPPGIDGRIGAGLQDGRKRTFSCKGINTGTFTNVKNDVHCAILIPGFGCVSSNEVNVRSHDVRGKH